MHYAVSSLSCRSLETAIIDQSSSLDLLGYRMYSLYQLTFSMHYLIWLWSTENVLSSTLNTCIQQHMTMLTKHFC